jgi:hypothetical protein
LLPALEWSGSSRRQRYDLWSSPRDGWKVDAICQHRSARANRYSAEHGRVHSCFPLLRPNAGSCRYLPEIFSRVPFSSFSAHRTRARYITASFANELHAYVAISRCAGATSEPPHSSAELRRFSAYRNMTELTSQFHSLRSIAVPCALACVCDAALTGLACIQTALTNSSYSSWRGCVVCRDLARRRAP